MLIRELGEQTEQDILEKIRQCVTEGYTRIDLINGELVDLNPEEPPVLRATLVAFNDDAE